MASFSLETMENRYWNGIFNIYVWVYVHMYMHVYSIKIGKEIKLPPSQR